MSDFRVVCGKCKEPPDFIPSPDGSNQVICPGCGATDDADDALRIAGQQFLQGNQSTIRDVVGSDPKGRKFVKFDPKRFPLRTFKWHAEAV